MSQNDNNQNSQNQSNNAATGGTGNTNTAAAPQQGQGTFGALDIVDTSSSSVMQKSLSDSFSSTTPNSNNE
jgi:hypothetical protein